MFSKFCTLFVFVPYCIDTGGCCIEITTIIDKNNSVIYVDDGMGVWPSAVDDGEYGSGQNGKGVPTAKERKDFIEKKVAEIMLESGEDGHGADAGGVGGNNSKDSKTKVNKKKNKKNPLNSDEQTKDAHKQAEDIWHNLLRKRHQKIKADIAKTFEKQEDINNISLSCKKKGLLAVDKGSKSCTLGKCTGLEMTPPTHADLGSGFGLVPFLDVHDLLLLVEFSPRPPAPNEMARHLDIKSSKSCTFAKRYIPKTSP